MYTRAYADWKNFPDTSTPISEAKLDILDDGIYDAHYNALVQSDAAGQVPLTARGFAGQSTDLFRVQNSTPTTLVRVDQNGVLWINDVSLTRSANLLTANSEIRASRTSDTATAFSTKGISAGVFMTVRADGQIDWGDGGGTFDTQLRRSTANTLALGANDKLVVGSGGIEFSDASVLTTAPTTTNTSGTLASRPAQPYASGSFYLATDQDVLYFSDGSTWQRTGYKAGHTLIWPYAAVPTGWVLLDGTNLPSSTGIYADFYAVNGSSLTKPNMKGVVPVGLDAAQSEFQTLLGSGGAKTESHTHTFSGTTGGGGSHSHSITVNNGGTHSHGMGQANVHAGAFTSGSSFAANNHTHSIDAGGDHGHSASSGSAGDHNHTYSGTTSVPSSTNNLQPYRVVHYIGKL